tara:strand:+ start:1265 stop:2680 length:1416 start_codon:yes stop_codon:yes gene_type:complete
MTELSRPWEGTTTGDAGPYTDDNWTDIWKYFLGGIGEANSGVFSNALNELEVTGAASPVTVDTGVALNDGTYYLNDVAVNVVVATPAAAQRIDRIVLRKDWALQTVRITLIGGVEGGGAPALTQVDGTTWDIPLYQLTVAFPGGAITLADEREWLSIKKADFQRFASSGNWTKPGSGMSHVLVVCIGSGGGGGGGEGQGAGNVRIGGAGGGGGAYAWKVLDATNLAATVAVTVGAGGAGGAGGVAGDGADGATGGTTSFGTSLESFGGGAGQGSVSGNTPGGGGGGTCGEAGVAADGAGGYPWDNQSQSTGYGTGGTGATSVSSSVYLAGGNGYAAEYGGGAGSTSGRDGSLGKDGGDSMYGAPGGGSGGGLTAGNPETTGGDGGSPGSYANGGGGAGGAVDGGAGTAGAAGVNDFCGEGGGGGGSNDDAAGGDGGDGGAPGGGGGGGGGGTNTGGDGGDGGDGEVRVWSW